MKRALFPLITLLACPASVFANHELNAYARVVSSTPVKRQIEVTRPREECWDEAVRHESGQDYTTGRTILGGLVGAAVGHQIGSGRGQDAATIVGAMAGASIGANSAHADHHHDHYVTHERVCRTVYETHTEERIEGYDVTYRYGGETYTTYLPYEPGKRIRVRVSVTPSSD